MPELLSALARLILPDSPSAVLRLAAVGLLMAIIGYLQFRWRFLQYLFFLRIPLICALVLLLLPLTLTTAAFSPLFTMESMPQLAAVAFMAAVSTWLITYSGSLIFVGASRRFSLRFREPDLGQEKNWDVNPPANRLPCLFEPQRRRAYIASLVLALPVLYFSFVESPLTASDRLLAIAGGLVAAVIARSGARWIAQRAVDWLRRRPFSLPARAFWRIRQRVRLLGYRFSETTIGRVFAWPFLRGYSNLVSDEVAVSRTPGQERETPVGHLKALSLVVLALVVYLVGAFVLDPSNTNKLAVRIASHTPALVYVILVVTLVGMLLAVVTYFLDFYRFPLFLFLGAVLLVSSLSSDLDHYYELTLRRPTAASARPSASDPITVNHVLAGWQAKHPPSSHPVMVVVAISGGGGQAARWTTEVLARLRADTRLGARFFESITFVSAVSGGALGAMYALDRYTPEAVPGVDALNAAARMADRSHVGALAWGATYPDLVRKILPKFFGTSNRTIFDARRDRGWALEQSWKAGLSDPSRTPTLASWAEEARDAKRPAVVFNATLVETGGRLLLSHVSVPTTGAQEFTRLYPEYDMSAATAVRLSATFPYLSPIARPMLPSEIETDRQEFERIAFHVADGGYYDSSGVLTVIDFLRAVMDDYKRFGRRKIVLLRILAARESENASGHRGWLASLDGPPTTALRTFQSTQISRNNLDVALLAERWHNADLREGTGVEIGSFVFRLPESGTLPWHLTRQEIEFIADSWNDDANRKELERLATFFAHQE